MVDNIFNLLIELMGGATLTADYLSKKLGVSRRTIYRYCDILSVSNIPLNMCIGAKGGIKLGEEFLISNQLFTPQELDLMKVSIAESPDKTLASSILSKLLALKKSKTSYSLKLDSIINICTANNRDRQDKKINVLDSAISNKYLVKISYHSRNGEVTERSIAPLNFIVKDGEWYIYCYCFLRQEFRTFKISRIDNFSTNKILHDIPTDYPHEWTFGSKDKINLSLRISAHAKYIVEEWLGMDSVLSDNDGYFANTIVENNIDTIYKLLSLGDGVEIIAPIELRNEYIAIIKNMLLKNEVVPIK